MIINNKTEEQLNIKADTPKIQKSKYSSEILLNKAILVPNIYDTKEELRKFECGFAVFGENELDITKNSSKFIEQVKKCIIKHEGLSYDLLLRSKDVEPNIFDSVEYFELEFDIFDCFEDEKSITTTKNTNININSPKHCYANLEIKSNIDAISYTIKINDTEITVRNLKGEETTYIGSGKVIAGGKSKINDVDMWEFPILKPGSNNIYVNRADVSLTIKYNERW